MQALSRRARAADGRERILAAAVEIFATVGFEGATLRRIADQAGEQHQLVVYHFKTKEGLWRAAVSALCADAAQAHRQRLAGLDGVDPVTTLRLMIREFVRFSAATPEFHRMTTFEGRTDNDRLRWIVDEFVREFYGLFTGLIAQVQSLGPARPGHPGQLYYAMIGVVTTSFVFAPEYRLMTGLEPFTPDHIEEIVGLASDFLMPAAGEP